jgi:hypothetical protein
MGLRKSGGLPSVKYVYREGDPPPPPQKKKKRKRSEEEKTTPAGPIIR